jgi:hypothetical protein
LIDIGNVAVPDARTDITRNICDGVISRKTALKQDGERGVPEVRGW